jgi:hypothetical protein
MHTETSSYNNNINVQIIGVGSDVATTVGVLRQFSFHALIDGTHIDG